MEQHATHEPASETVTVLNANILTPYLRTRFTTDNNRLRIDGHRTILGLVPAGRRHLELSLSRLASIGVATTVRLECVVTVAALGALIVFAHLPLAAGIPIGLLAAWLIPLSVIKAIKIEDREGRRWWIPICWFHTFDAELVAADVQARRAAVAA